MDLLKLTRTSSDNFLETFLRKKAELKDLIDHKTLGTGLIFWTLIRWMLLPNTSLVMEEKMGIIHALRS